MFRNILAFLAVFRFVFLRLADLPFPCLPFALAVETSTVQPNRPRSSCVCHFNVELYLKPYMLKRKYRIRFSYLKCLPVSSQRNILSKYQRKINLNCSFFDITKDFPGKQNLFIILCSENNHPLRYEVVYLVRKSN